MFFITPPQDQKQLGFGALSLTFCFLKEGSFLIAVGKGSEFASRSLSGSSGQRGGPSGLGFFRAGGATIGLCGRLGMMGRIL